MRYCRQNLLKILNKNKQKLLYKSLVTVIGLGAIGTRSVELLARAGVKNFILIDRDIVEITNLQRQALYVEEDLYKEKCEQTKKHLLEIDASLNIITFTMDLNNLNIIKLISKKTNLILDCTDNYDTKFLLNKFAVENNIPLIYSVVLQTRGYVFNILPKGPCLSCFLKNPSEFLGNCDIHGILNTACSLISTLQANEAIKILTKQEPEKTLIFADIWKNIVEKIKVKKNNRCKICQ